MGGTGQRAARAALDAARASLQQLDHTSNAEDVAATYIEAWDSTEEALKALAGTSALVFHGKVHELKRVEWTPDLFKFSTQKIPCESNCPSMVVTDTLNCRKELEGFVDMEEVRGTGRCPFWPHKDLETE